MIGYLALIFVVCGLCIGVVKLVSPLPGRFLETEGSERAVLRNLAISYEGFDGHIPKNPQDPIIFPELMLSDHGGTVSSALQISPPKGKSISRVRCFVLRKVALNRPYGPALPGLLVKFQNNNGPVDHAAFFATFDDWQAAKCEGAYPQNLAQRVAR